MCYLAAALLGAASPGSAYSASAEGSFDLSAFDPADGPVMVGETDGQTWLEHYWPSGRLAEVRCVISGATPSLRDGKCRYKDFTGTLTTYHRDGSVSEVMHLQDGILDGIAERYDPHGQLLERTYLQHGQELYQNDYGLPLGKRLGAAEPRPPLPPSSSTGAGIRGSGPPGRYLARPPFRPIYEFGFSSMYVYGHSSYDYFNEYGFGAPVYLLVQLHRHLGIEVDMGLLPNWSSGDREYDWPILRLGLRVPLTQTRFVPYFLGGSSLVYAKQIDPRSDPQNPTDEGATYVGVDGGIGFTYYLSERITMSLDFRFGRNFRIDGGQHIVLPNDSGVPEEMMGSYYTFVTNFGLGVQWQ